MKKINFLLSAFAVLVALLPLGAMAQDRGILGDANGDGKVNITDVTTIINYLLSGDGSAIDLSAADVDGNGTVKITDVTELINILLGNAEPTHPDTKTFTYNGVTFTMSYVAPGTFTMGATPEQGSDAENREKPAHQVTLTRGFYISQTEVTFGLLEAVMGTNVMPATGPSDYPAMMISDSMAKSFCNVLGSYLGLDLDLPTEAEWEYAARGGHKSLGYKYSGSDNIDEVAWYKSNSGGTYHPVAQKKPNELDLYDMSGNVNEWCRDRIELFYNPYPSEPQVDPCNNSAYGNTCMVRGGTKEDVATRCRVSARYEAQSLNMLTGFRFIFYVD